MFNLRFDQIGKQDPKKARILRIKEILNKEQPVEDDAVVLISFIQSNCNEYKVHFCQYTPSMFLQLMKKISCKTLKMGQNLYNKGDYAAYFYCVLEGRIESLVTTSSGDLKVNKTIDDGAIFGKMEGMDKLRNDCGKCSKDTTILEIEIEAYETIIANRILSEPEKKVEFLNRFVPQVRKAKKMMEEYDVLFLKEVYTKGYNIVHYLDYDDYVYFIYKGLVNVFIPTPDSIKNKAKQSQKYLLLGALKAGESFGEDSGLNGEKSPYLFEASEDGVECYKISKATLLEYFGGSGGDIMLHLRGRIQIRANWIKSKLIRLSSINFSRLTFRIEEERKKLDPKKVNPKEIPFAKRIQEVNKVKDTASEKDEVLFKLKKLQDEAPTHEKREQQPPSNPRQEFFKKQANAPSAPTVKRRDGEVNSYKGVLGFGTPRLVASNRIKGAPMSTVQLQGLSTLRNVASVRIPNNQSKNPMGFEIKSVKRFTQNVMEADSEINKNALVKKERGAGDSFPKPKMNIFQKMKLSNEQLTSELKLRQDDKE